MYCVLRQLFHYECLLLLFFFFAVFSCHIVIVLMLLIEYFILCMPSTACHLCYIYLHPSAHYVNYPVFSVISSLRSSLIYFLVFHLRCKNDEHFLQLSPRQHKLITLHHLEHSGRCILGVLMSAGMGAQFGRLASILLVSQ